MGNKRLGHLPKTKVWYLIADELVTVSLRDSNSSEITQITLRNVQEKFSNFRNDPTIH